MNVLDRLLRHDAWTTRQLLLLCRNLSDEQLNQEFDIAHQSVRATLLHIIYNMEVWTDCMMGQSVRVAEGTSVADFIQRLDAAADDLARVSRDVAQRDGWDELWRDPIDGRERSYGGAIAHVITHSMHHRAQLLYMLRRLGVEELPEGDVLSWERQSSS